MRLPEAKEKILNDLVSDLQDVENIAAIVLGGSYATGFANENSDIDIGIYYFQHAPFEVASVKSIAEKYATEPPTVTNFYEWGPWVNGGAWIETSAGKIDFIYKNIDQIQSVIEKSENGEWENHFEQQPPFGFSSLMFLAETRCCIPLYDKIGIINRLKKEVEIYPEKLKAAVIQQSLWAAEFTISHADVFFNKNDVYNTVGCLTRAVKNIVNTLFAVNEIYPISDKRAVEILEKCSKIPDRLREKTENILCVEKPLKYENIYFLKEFFQETISLTDGSYKPYYAFKKE